MKRIYFLLLAMIFILSCARVKVEAPKEPIKVDISMRLDIYQHVEKDIDRIENIVAGKDKQGALNSFVGVAFAQEELSPEVEQAALRRKDRRSELNSLQEKGIVGEDKAGMVQIRNASLSDSSVQQLVNAENNDRMVIYESVAQKNNITIEEVQKMYAQRLQGDSPSGTPIEALTASGRYEWKNKP